MSNIEVTAEQARAIYQATCDACCEVSETVSDMTQWKHLTCLRNSAGRFIGQIVMIEPGADFAILEVTLLRVPVDGNFEKPFMVAAVNLYADDSVDVHYAAPIGTAIIDGTLARFVKLEDVA